MKELLSVTNSDKVNKYGYAFSFGSLEEVTYQNALVGIPACIGHDRLRPVGWNFPLGLYLEPSLTRTVSTFILPDSKKEEKEIRKAHRSALIQRYSEMSEPFVDTLKSTIEEHLSGKQKLIHCDCTCLIDDSILERVFPKLKTKKDKDGLIFLKDLRDDFQYLEHGAFKHLHTDLAILVHPFFRRRLSRHNNFHFMFLDELM